MKYECIIWDFNGTIIDDAWVAVAAENKALEERGLPKISMEFYLRECEMPIENFYRKIYDFSKYDFQEIARRFLHYYDIFLPQAEIFPDVSSAIERFSKAGVKQGVISSFETSRLVSILRSKDLDKYFEFVSGADDNSCGSKVERAAAVVKKHGFKPEKTLFIGDMYHDFEAAQGVGADCVLIARGHQGAQILREYKNVTVFDNAEPLAEYCE